MLTERDLFQNIFSATNVKSGRIGVVKIKKLNCEMKKYRCCDDHKDFVTPNYIKKKSWCPPVMCIYHRNNSPAEKSQKGKKNTRRMIFCTQGNSKIICAEKKIALSLN